MPWSVTIKPGLRNVVMPDMQRYQGGDVVMLSDDQISLLSKTSFAALFTAAPASANTSWPTGGV